MKTLKDKVIVITGASSGIGEAMAREYAARGAKVVLGARSVQKLQLLAGEIRRHGGQAAYCGVDVTRPEECRGLIDTAVREFGGVDVLVCNAGISMRALFDDVELEVLHRSAVGRVYTYIIRGKREDILHRMQALSPLLLEAIPLTLEEIFIYELGGADYAVRDIIL